jgi:hypothetical protein
MRPVMSCSRREAEGDPLERRATLPDIPEQPDFRVTAAKMFVPTSERETTSAGNAGGFFYRACYSSRPSRPAVSRPEFRPSLAVPQRRVSGY